MAKPKHTVQTVKASAPSSRALAKTPPREMELRSLTNAVIARAQFFQQAGVTFGGKRDLYDILGYEPILRSVDYRSRYARGGIAKRIVEAYPNATWRGGVELVESPNPNKMTDFETQWITLDSRLNIIPTLRQADILTGLSTFAVILLGTAGGSDLSTELPRGKGPDDLLYLAPFGGASSSDINFRKGQRSVKASFDTSYAWAIVKEYESDPKSARYGSPTMYTLRAAGNLLASDSLGEVHWTRIIHLAEGCLDNDIFGVPALEACWNLLDDLDKVTGGGSEAYWLRVNRGLQVDIDKDMDLSDKAKAELQDNMDKYEHGMLRMMRTRGVTVNDLGSMVANFANSADSIITQIAGTKAIPKRILTGSEMGDLASSQDRDNWKDQVNGRQTMHAGPVFLRQLVDRLIKYNYLPIPVSYEVSWPHIQTLTESERFEGAKAWAMINKFQGSPVFTDAEIRNKWYLMDPLSAVQIADEQKKMQATAPQPKLLAPALIPKPAPDPALKAAEDEDEFSINGNGKEPHAGSTPS